MNNNNMKNTKTIKTLLFASLIAAMILPFSGMQPAQAEEVSYDKALKMLDEYEVEAKSRMSTSDFTHADEKALKRIQLSKELVVFDKYRKEMPEQYGTKGLDMKIDSILTQINTIYASDNVIVGEVTPAPDNLAFGYGTDWDTNPTTYNCWIQQNSNGNNDGTQYSASSTQIGYWVNVKYPSTFSKGTIPCPANSFDRSFASILSYRNPYPVCTMNLYGYYDATFGLLCTGGNWDNALALVTTNAYYANGVDFKQEFSYIIP